MGVLVGWGRRSTHKEPGPRLGRIRKEEGQCQSSHIGRGRAKKRRLKGGRVYACEPACWWHLASAHKCVRGWKRGMCSHPIDMGGCTGSLAAVAGFMHRGARAHGWPGGKWRRHGKNGEKGMAQGQMKTRQMKTRHRGGSAVGCSGARGGGRGRLDGATPRRAAAPGWVTGRVRARALWVCAGCLGGVGGWVGCLSI